MFDMCVCVYPVFCVVLCLGSGFATNLSLIKGVLSSAKNDYRSEYARALNGLEELLKKFLSLVQKLSLRKTIPYAISLFEF
jgi:hypothetical protein